MAKILLLEPDSVLAGNIERYFANAKHTVSVHSDPQQAVTSADSRAPDLIIAELQLAGRSGVEFLYEFRSYPEWQNIPVIILTSQILTDQDRGYLMKKAFAVMGKGSERAELEIVLRRTMQISGVDSNGTSSVIS